MLFNIIFKITNDAFFVQHEMFFNVIVAVKCILLQGKENKVLDRVN